MKAYPKSTAGSVRGMGRVLKKIAAVAAVLRQGVNGLVPAAANPDIRLGRPPRGTARPTLAVFPYAATTLSCGLTGIVTYHNKPVRATGADLPALNAAVDHMETGRYAQLQDEGKSITEDAYLGGKPRVEALYRSVQRLKQKGTFQTIFNSEPDQRALDRFVGRLRSMADEESRWLTARMGRLSTVEVDIMSKRIEEIRDVAWAVEKEILENFRKIRDLFPEAHLALSDETIQVFKNINAVLNSIDRLEVRGRDSAGVSLMFVLGKEAFESFSETLDNTALRESFEGRKNRPVMVNNGISILQPAAGGSNGTVTVALTYKVAAEIGSLGDNVIFLRWQIKNDPILQTLVNFDCLTTPSCPTPAGPRWAPSPKPTAIRWTTGPKKTSRGRSASSMSASTGTSTTTWSCKSRLEATGVRIHRDITTDTKIIPLQIEKYIREGAPVEAAFRLAVNDFEGSHAISMHTDLAPGKLFLAQKGQRPGDLRRAGRRPLHAGVRSVRVCRGNRPLPQAGRRKGRPGPTGGHPGPDLHPRPGVGRPPWRASRPCTTTARPCHWGSRTSRHTEITVPRHRPAGFSPLFSQGNLRVPRFGGKNPPEPLEDVRGRRCLADRQPGRNRRFPAKCRNRRSKTGTSGGSFSSDRAPPGWPPRPAPTSSATT